jgi:membrane associated rhomboid family serine protease
MGLRRYKPLDRLPPHVGDGVISVGLVVLGVWLLTLGERLLVGSDAVARVLVEHVALSVAAVARLELWTLLTYGLLHDLGTPWHILFNVLALYWFGPPIERLWGTSRFLRFVLIAVLCGGLVQVGLDVITGGRGIVVGVSAATMGLFALFSWLRPDARILLFFVLPVQGRYLLPIVIGFDLLSWLTQGGLAFGAHLGGVLWAWLVWNGVDRPGGPRRILRKLQQRAARLAGGRGDGRGGGRGRGAGTRRGGFEVLDGGKKPGKYDIH